MCLFLRFTRANLRQNKIKNRVRTPGNRLVVQYLKKLHLKHRSVPKCADTGKPLRGMLPNRGNYKNRRLNSLQQRRKAVSRSYGGCLSHSAVRERITRAFLVEEARILRKVNRRRRLQREGKRVRPRLRGRARRTVAKTQQRRAARRKAAEAKALTQK